MSLAPSDATLTPGEVLPQELSIGDPVWFSHATEAYLPGIVSRINVDALGGGAGAAGAGAGAGAVVQAAEIRLDVETLRLHTASAGGAASAVDITALPRFMLAPHLTVTTAADGAMVVVPASRAARGVPRVKVMPRSSESISGAASGGSSSGALLGVDNMDDLPHLHE